MEYVLSFIIPFLAYSNGIYIMIVKGAYPKNKNATYFYFEAVFNDSKSNIKNKQCIIVTAFPHSASARRGIKNSKIIIKNSKC